MVHMASTVLDTYTMGYTPFQKDDVWLGLNDKLKSIVGYYTFLDNCNMFTWLSIIWLYVNVYVPVGKVCSVFTGCFSVTLM
jgi:hypothetical protein